MVPVAGPSCNPSQLMGKLVHAQGFGWVWVVWDAKMAILKSLAAFSNTADAASYFDWLCTVEYSKIYASCVFADVLKKYSFRS